MNSNAIKLITKGLTVPDRIVLEKFLKPFGYYNANWENLKDL